MLASTPWLRRRWDAEISDSSKRPHCSLRPARLRRLDCCATAALLGSAAETGLQGQAGGGERPPPPATPRSPGERVSYVSPMAGAGLPASPFASVREDEGGPGAAGGATRLGRGQQSFTAALQARDEAARRQLAAQAARAAALGGRLCSGGAPALAAARAPSCAPPSGSANGSDGPAGRAVTGRASLAIGVTARPGAVVLPCLDRYLQHAAGAAAAARSAPAPLRQRTKLRSAAVALTHCLDRQLFPCLDRLAAPGAPVAPAAGVPPPAPAVVLPAAAAATKPVQRAPPRVALAANCTRGPPAPVWRPPPPPPPTPYGAAAQQDSFFGDVGVALGPAPGAQPRPRFPCASSGATRGPPAALLCGHDPPAVRATGGRSRAAAAAAAVRRVHALRAKEAAPAPSSASAPDRCRRCPRRPERDPRLPRAATLPAGAPPRTRGRGDPGWLPLVRESQHFLEDAGFDTEAFLSGVLTRPATPEPPTGRMDAQA